MDRRASRTLLAVLAVVAALVLLTVGPTEARAERQAGEIDFVVRLEPPDLVPGAEGVLVVRSRIEHELHLYADGSEAVSWKPISQAGVTYQVPTTAGVTWEDFEKKPGRVTWNKPTLRPVPGFPNAPPDAVWEEGYDFEIRIPVSIAATTAADASLGLVFDYSACDEMNCYDRVRGHEATVKLGESPPIPASDSGASGGRFVAGSAPEDAAARVTLKVKKGAQGGLVATVSFLPFPGFHLYMPDSTGDPIAVEPLPDAGVTWGEWEYPEFGDEIREPYVVQIPLTATEGAKQIRVRVEWQGCDDVGSCERPQARTIVATFHQGAGEAIAQPAIPMVDPGSAGSAPPPPPPPPSDAPSDPSLAGETWRIEPASETVPFPVVYGDDLNVADQSDSGIEQAWKDSWVLALILVFLGGIGLAFTPCVLPIIPLTISVIGGGNPNISRSRLTVLLSFYVAGLAGAYAAAGAAGGALGKAINLEAAFQNPVILWVIAGIFFLLAMSMMGVFEMQPPAWMERLRGGAQKKSGTIIGSFLLGLLAALIASPCTGPFVVGMLTFVAKTGSPVIGFVIFGTLGLGMGAVFFAAGSLNMLARPGPWMVWVRYVFGIILFGLALYYVASSGQLDTVMLFVVGFGAALVTWWAVTRHLIRKEGESPEKARVRGAMLAVSLVMATGAVAWLTRAPADGPSGWIKIKDVAHLKQEVERAKKEERPVVVDVWATWCHYCKVYDAVIASDEGLKKDFEKMVRLKLDVTKDRPEEALIREALGLPDGQPLMAFFDEEGRIRRAADIDRYHGDESVAELKKRTDFLFHRTEGASE